MLTFYILADVLADLSPQYLPMDQMFTPDLVADLPYPSKCRSLEHHYTESVSHIEECTYSKCHLLVNSRSEVADLDGPLTRHDGIYIIGMYLAAIVDSSRKGGNLLLFLNN